jgi:hypothetical protein
MTQALVGARAGSCTLYQVEDDLQAWVNTLDGVDQESTRQEILQEIGQAVRLAREKRDAVAGFLRHCADQEEFADAEIQRVEIAEGLYRARSAGTGSPSHPHCR